MYLETVFRFYLPLNHIICNSLFRFVRLGSFSDIIQRYFSLTFTKLHFYVDMSVRFFVGKQYYRLHMSIKLKHIPTKTWKYGQYLCSTNVARVSYFPQISFFSRKWFQNSSTFHFISMFPPTNCSFLQFFK